MLLYSSPHNDSKQHGSGQSMLNAKTLRCWIISILLLALFGFAMHEYFEYRNRELDKRLEQIRHIPKGNLKYRLQEFIFHFHKQSSSLKFTSNEKTD